MSSHPRTTLRQPGSSGTATPTATHGSQTLLETTQSSASGPSNTLRLRAQQTSNRGPRVQWAEDVVDNEGMGKKSSKVCCIYHKPHEPGDSDEESSSDSGSDSDSEPDLSRARKAGVRGRRKGHAHGDGDGEGEGGDKGEGQAGARKASPNAYERQPSGKGKGKKEG